MVDTIMQGSQKGRQSQEPETYRLRLYIVGGGENSFAAQQSLQHIQRRLPADSRVEVIDILRDAVSAREAELALVPALTVSLGTQHTTFYGRLTNTEEIVSELGEMKGE